MDQYYSENLTVQYQSKFYPHSCWFSGSVADFADSAEIEYSESDGGGGDTVFLLAKETDFAWYNLGDPLPDEVLKAEGQPVMFYWRPGSGFIFQIYEHGAKFEDE